MLIVPTDGSVSIMLSAMRRAMIKSLSLIRKQISFHRLKDDGNQIDAIINSFGKILGDLVLRWGWAQGEEVRSENLPVFMMYGKLPFPLEWSTNTNLACI